jgi:hypothetical protein
MTAGMRIAVFGHIQATGTDSRGRVQYRYHQLWREQRDEQKFAHMLRFAAGPVLLPGCRPFLACPSFTRCQRLYRGQRGRSFHGARSAVSAGVRAVAAWLGDTPTVARSAYIDPRLIARYCAGTGLAGVPVLPVSLPARAEAEQAVAALLADGA